MTRAEMENIHRESSSASELGRALGHALVALDAAEKALEAYRDQSDTDQTRRELEEKLAACRSGLGIDARRAEKAENERDHALRENGEQRRQIVALEAAEKRVEEERGARAEAEESVVGLESTRRHLLKECARLAPVVVHASDCATHNEPAEPNGPCDCPPGIAAPMDGLIAASAAPTQSIGDSWGTRDALRAERDALLARIESLKADGAAACEDFGVRLSEVRAELAKAKAVSAEYIERTDRHQDALAAELAREARMREEANDYRNLLEQLATMPHHCIFCGLDVGGVPKRLHGAGCLFANTLDKHLDRHLRSLSPAVPGVTK